MQWNACVHRLDLAYSHIQKSFWGLESETILTPRGNSLLPEAQRRSNPRRCIKQDRQPNTLPTELFRPTGEIYEEQMSYRRDVPYSSTRPSQIEIPFCRLTRQTAFVGWLLNVAATCQCISGTDLHRQFYVLPHSDRSCRPYFPSHPVTVC